MLQRNASYLYRYNEVLKSGTWSSSDPVRAVVADLIRQLGPGSCGSLRLDLSGRTKGQAACMVRALRSVLRTLNPYRRRPII